MTPVLKSLCKSEGNGCNVHLGIEGIGEATVDGDFSDWREEL